VITHESNKQYYLDIMFYPAARELQPDRMALYSPMYMISRRPAPIETVASFAGGPGGGAGKYVITDGERILQIFHVQDMAYELEDSSYAQGNHSADMLMAYLPKEKILIQCRSLLAASAGRADAHSTGWDADALSEYAEAEVGRSAARAHSRTRRNQ
jgi:hypothetical protein